MMRILERQGDRMTIQASSMLERGDYQRVVPQLEEAIARHSKLRVLIELHDFRGWHPVALFDELRFDVRHRKDIARCAVVGDRTSERWITKLISPFFEGDVRFFDREKLSDARQWLNPDGAPGASCGPQS